MKKSTGPTQTRQVVFNISQNFKVLKILGEGAYGIVALAVHLPTETKVAIKKSNHLKDHYSVFVRYEKSNY